MKLIDKDTLVAEIEKRNKDAYGNEWGWVVKCETYSEILSILDTLEVKKVDIKKEFCDYFEKNFMIGMTGMILSNNGEPINTIKLLEIVKHFFELGMQVSNK